MKIITNEDLIAKRKKMASTITPFAMLFLIGGLVTNFLSIREGSNAPNFALATVVLLALGFITATVSSTLVNHWVREPRPDQVLANSLKGFDNRYILFNYTSKIHHVLVTQNAVYAVTPKLTKGEISVNKRKWRRKFKVSRLFRFFGEESLGNPTIEAEHNRDKLAELISKSVDEGESIPVMPLILFTDPDVDLTIQDSEIPVMTGGRLKKFLRQNTKSSSPDFNNDYRKQLIAALSN